MAPPVKRNSGGPSLNAGALAGILTMATIMLFALICLVYLCARATSRYGKIHAEFERRGLSFTTPKPKARTTGGAVGTGAGSEGVAEIGDMGGGEITADVSKHPGALLQRNKLLPYSRGAGWGELTSREELGHSLNDLSNPNAGRQEGQENDRLKPPSTASSVKSDLLRLAKLRSPRMFGKGSSVSLMTNTPGRGELPKSMGHHPKLTKEQLAVFQRATASAPERQISRHTIRNSAPTFPSIPLIDTIPSKPVPSFQRSFPRAGRSFSTSAISKSGMNLSSHPSRPLSRPRSLNFASQTHGFSSSDGSNHIQAWRAATARSAGSRRKVFSRSTSHNSVSSVESGSSSVVVGAPSPFAARFIPGQSKKEQKREAAAAAAASAAASASASTSRLQVPEASTSTLYGRCYNPAHGTLRANNTARFSTENLSVSTRSRSASINSSCKMSVALQPSAKMKTPDSQAVEDEEDESLEAPGVNTITIPVPQTQGTATPPRRRSQVTPFGSPAERKKPVAARDMGVNQSKPTRQLSQASIDVPSTRSSFGNPFQWDSSPTQMGKQPGTKGSPGTRKRYSKQSNVRISLAPTVIHGLSRSSSPAPMNDIKEESPPSSTHSSPIGLGVTTNKSFPQPPSSLIYPNTTRRNSRSSSRRGSFSFPHKDFQQQVQSVTSASQGQVQAESSNSPNSRHKVVRRSASSVRIVTDDTFVHENVGRIPSRDVPSFASSRRLNEITNQEGQITIKAIPLPPSPLITMFALSPERLDGDEEDSPQVYWHPPSQRSSSYNVVQLEINSEGCPTPSSSPPVFSPDPSGMNHSLLVPGTDSPASSSMALVSRSPAESNMFVSPATHLSSSRSTSPALFPEPSNSSTDLIKPSGTAYQYPSQSFIVGPRTQPAPKLCRTILALRRMNSDAREQQRYSRAERKYLRMGRTPKSRRGSFVPDDVEEVEAEYEGRALICSPMESHYGSEPDLKSPNVGGRSLLLGSESSPVLNGNWNEVKEHDLDDSVNDRYKRNSKNINITSNGNNYHNEHHNDSDSDSDSLPSRPRSRIYDGFQNLHRADGKGMIWEESESGAEVRTIDEEIEEIVEDMSRANSEIVPHDRGTPIIPKAVNAHGDDELDDDTIAAVSSSGSIGRTPLSLCPKKKTFIRSDSQHNYFSQQSQSQQKEKQKQKQQKGQKPQPQQLQQLQQEHQEQNDDEEEEHPTLRSLLASSPFPASLRGTPEGISYATAVVEAAGIKRRSTPSPLALRKLKAPPGPSKMREMDANSKAVPRPLRPALRNATAGFSNAVVVPGAAIAAGASPGGANIQLRVGSGQGASSALIKPLGGIMAQPLGGRRSLYDENGHLRPEYLRRDGIRGEGRG